MLVLALVALAESLAQPGLNIKCNTLGRSNDEHIFGVPAAAAHLSWHAVEGSKERGEVQVAYELQISAAEQLIWTSNKTASSSQQLVVPEDVLKGKIRRKCSFVFSFGATFS